MALPIKTDSEFDKALQSPSGEEKRRGFDFGALRDLQGPEDTSESIARKLKEMDEDHDLD